MRAGRGIERSLWSCQVKIGVLFELCLDTHMQHDALLIVLGSGNAACASYTSVDGCFGSTSTDAV